MEERIETRTATAMLFILESICTKPDIFLQNYEFTSCTLYRRLSFCPIIIFSLCAPLRDEDKTKYIEQKRRMLDAWHFQSQFSSRKPFYFLSIKLSIEQLHQSRNAVGYIISPDFSPLSTFLTTESKIFCSLSFQM